MDAHPGSESRSSEHPSVPVHKTFLSRLVEGSVRHALGVLGVTALLAAFLGATALWLDFDALPDLTNNQVIVLTGAPGFTPEEVERRVTAPIETALGGAPGLLEQRSLSRSGISSVTVVFHDDVDPYRARQLVSERLATVGDSLPEGVEAPELAPLTGGLGEVFHFSLASPVRTAAELYELATYRVAPLLRSVPGVVEVNTWGGARRTADVVVHPDALARHGLVLSDVTAALEASVGSVPGLTLRAGAGQALLRGWARPEDPLELLQIPVRVPGHRPPMVPLSQLATVREGQLPRTGASTSNGRGEVVYLMAQMLRDANALSVVDGIHARMDEVHRILPPDVQVEVIYDRQVLVRQTLKTVAGSLAEGAVLVIGALLLMLGSLRAGLVVALAIPLSMLGAVAAMHLAGITGNLMSLGAIDFGLLVDGAVVMVEAVFHSSMRAGQRWTDRVRVATSGVARPVFFGVLIVALVYVPVLALGGVEGKLFRPMAVAAGGALLLALVVSLTVIPALVARLLTPASIPERDPVLVRALRWGHAKLLDGAAAHPVWTNGTAALLFAAGVVLASGLGIEFAPQLDEGDLVIQTTRATQTSLDASVSEGNRLEQAVLQVPEVTRIASRHGSPAVATDIMGPEQADIFVGLRPRSEWRSGLTLAGLVDEVDGLIQQAAPGSNPSYTQPIQMRFNELLGGAVTDVAISVFGDDLQQLRQTSDAVAEAIRPIAGATDVRVLAPESLTLVEVRPRLAESAAVGLTARDVLDVVRAEQVGIEVGALWRGPQSVPVRVRLEGASDALTLGDRPVAVPDGRLVPLRQVAEVVTTEAPGLVQRLDAQRRLVVGFNVRGADLGTVVDEARRRVGAQVRLPDGDRLVWGGQVAQLAEARARLSWVLPLVLALIVAALWGAFGAIRPALILLTLVPFALVGGTTVLAWRGLPVSMPAVVGFIALSGVVVLNGVVLLSRIRDLEDGGMEARVAALEAARERARPVLTTALVAALGFVPMMLATGVGSEVQRPLASVVVGGLFTATPLTLLVFPVAYPWLAGRRRHSRRDGAVSTAG